jgi:acyl-CoA reductase-like NAD-dependent aldehyde dehydrogenase
VASIAPWNYPLMMAAWKIAPALAAGNTVVLKPSEQTPLTTLELAVILAELFPPGVVNIVTGRGESVGSALTAEPAVRMISLTGDISTGRKILDTAARTMKRTHLELGGKAPVIVLDDADLDEAVKAAAFGAFMNQGQICMSTERIIVVEAVAEAFIEKFRAKVGAMAVGDPRAGKTPLGAVVDLKTVQHVEGLVADAVGKGAVQVNGGPSAGVLMPATVIDGVTEAMALYREESFGPVVAVIRARDEAHAVDLANDTEYGLSAAVFTRDTARGLRVARQIRSGICHVNGPTVHDEAQMPFGGVKSSGYGRFGGKAGIEAFTDLRWITIETQPGHYPI